MINVSEYFREYCMGANARTFTLRIHNVTDDADLNCEIKEFSMYKGSSDEPGGIYIPYIEMQLAKYEDDLLGKTLDIYTGATFPVFSGDPQTEEVRLGRFYVSEFERQRLNLYANKGEPITESVRVLAVGALASKCDADVTIAQDETVSSALSKIQGATGFPVTACSLVIQTDTLDSMHGPAKAILSAIAKKYNCFVTEGSEGNLVIGFPHCDQIWVDSSSFSTNYGIGDDDVCKNTVADDISTVPSRYMQIEGAEYYPARSRWTLGNPLIEGVDIVDLNSPIGMNETLIPVLEVVHTFDGGWQSDISAMGAKPIGQGTNKGPIGEVTDLLEEKMAIVEDIIEKIPAGVVMTSKSVSVSSGAQTLTFTDSTLVGYTHIVVTLSTSTSGAATGVRYANIDSSTGQVTINMLSAATAAGTVTINYVAW